MLEKVMLNETHAELENKKFTKNLSLKFHKVLRYFL